VQTAPSGAVWTLSDSSSELLTAVLELLTALFELFREGCISNKSNGGWPRRAALERCDGVWLCDVMSCLHGYSLDSMHSDMSRDMTLPSDGLPHPGVPNGSQWIPKDHTPHTHESERKAFLFHSILMP